MGRVNLERGACYCPRLTTEGRMIEHVPLYLLPKPDPGPYEAGRLCDTCSALLSRNNPGPECYPCQRKVAESGQPCSCPGCLAATSSEIHLDRAIEVPSGSSSPTPGAVRVVKLAPPVSEQKRKLARSILDDAVVELRPDDAA